MTFCIMTTGSVRPLLSPIYWEPNIAEHDWEIHYAKMLEVETAVSEANPFKALDPNDIYLYADVKKAGHSRVELPHKRLEPKNVPVTRLIRGLCSWTPKSARKWLEYIDHCTINTHLLWSTIKYLYVVQNGTNLSVITFNDIQ